jgi:hypothetical protein
MPDRLQPIQDANDAYKDVMRLLREVGRMQDKQLAKAKQFNIENQLLSEIKKSHLTDEQRLLSIQTSVVEKTKVMVELEGSRRDLLRAGYATTSVEILAINKYLRDMRRETRAAVKEYDSLLFKMSLMTSLLETANKIGFEEMLKFSKELRTQWSTHPILGIKTVLLKAVDIFNVLDTAAAKFRQEMGFTRTFTKGIDEAARQVAFDFAHIGVTAEKAYEAVAGISKALFSSMSVTPGLVRDISILSAQLGISAEVSSEFMKNLGIAFKSTAGAKADMTFFTAALSEAAGVPLDAVMRDVNNATRNSYQFISRTGVGLIKAAIEARRMGTSLESATQTSRSLLNFTQNVKDEMEASVLVGQAINLQKARELAYHRDIRGLNQEILKIMKDTNFENLDPFQQDAVARALGKSAGELADMAQAERQRLDWERSTDPVVQSQLRAYKSMMAATESIAKENGKNMRLQLQIRANQAAIASITQSWNAILNRMGEAVLPVIDVFLKSIAGILGIINRFMGMINAKFGVWGKIFNGLVVVAGLLFGPKLLGKLVSWVTGGLFKGIGKAVGDLLGGIAGGVRAFGKGDVLKGVVGILALGIAMIPFAYACKLMAGVPWPVILAAGAAMIALAVAAAIIGAVMMSGVGTVAILAGAAAIVILGLAMIPFAYAATLAAKAIKSLADVDIPKIALGLGMLGIAVMPLAAVTPLLPLMAIGLGGLSLALRLLAGPAERVGNAMMSVGAGLKMTAESLTQLQNLSLVNTVMQVRSLASAIMDLSKAMKAMPDISVEKLKAIALAGGGAQEAKDNTSEMLSAIKDSIDGLRADFKSGALTAAVYIDSQKLDAVMGRRLAYTGQLV